MKDDDLNTARGIVQATCLSLIFWAVIVLPFEIFR